MSNEVKKGTSKKASVLRLATFVTEQKGTELIFRPVNKRAKRFAKLVGKRTRLTRDDIKAIKATKKVKVAVYVNGSLKAIR